MPYNKILHGQGDYDMTRPNIFSFATSELSQDAMICWLFSWAKPECKDIDSELHLLGVALIHAIFKKHQKTPPIIQTLKITKQDKNIDVLCVVNGKFAILIEDKTITKDHSAQLERYFEEVKSRGFNEENILPTYYKTGDQSSYNSLEKTETQPEYKLFNRSDILNVLNTYTGDNTLAKDYRSYLQGISDEVQSYKTLPLKDWTWHSWIGFYLELQKEFDGMTWDYVANPSGGFLGAWWYFQSGEICRPYLQLEEEKLCFKIEVNDPRTEKRRQCRDFWHSRIMNKSLDSDLPIIKPGRFGSGQYMTVCEYGGDYRVQDASGVLDMDKTLNHLKQAENVLKSLHTESCH